MPLLAENPRRSALGSFAIASLFFVGSLGLYFESTGYIINWLGFVVIMLLLGTFVLSVYRHFWTKMNNYHYLETGYGLTISLAIILVIPAGLSNAKPEELFGSYIFIALLALVAFLTLIKFVYMSILFKKSKKESEHT